MMAAKNNRIKVFWFLLVLFYCFNLLGCSTLGSAGTGLANGLSTLVMLPFKIAGKVLDIVAKMPKPPPGVF